MSFIIEQKIKGKIYLYEATSFWDPEKKQSRQRRKYLGKKDAQTNEPVTPRKLPVVSSALDFGHSYLLTELIKSLGLKEILLQAFTAEKVEALLSLVYFQVLESKPWYLYESWSEGIYCKGLVKLTSQRISELLHELGKDESSIVSFFRHWASSQKPMKGVFLDITSLSSYGQNNNWLEWGYNRDGEPLPQVNLGVLLGGTLQLPFFYQLYPGSIADVSTLHNIALRAQDLGFDIETWIMDRGFFSTSNIAHLEAQSYKFVTAMPSTLKEAQRILTDFQAGLTSPTTSFCLGKEVLFVEDTTCQIGKLKLRACLYLNQKRRAGEIEAFILRLEELENAVKSLNFKNENKDEEKNEVEKNGKESNNKDIDKSENEVKEWLNRQWKGSANFYTIAVKDDGFVTLHRKDDVLSIRMNTMGKMILVTNRIDLTPKEVLEQYRNKDRVEKVYDTLKNGLNEDRLRTHSISSMEGKMFVTFLSLIVQTALANRMNSSELTKTFSIPELVMELKKIRCFERTNQQPSFLSEISKKQRDIFTKLTIPIPKAP